VLSPGGAAAPGGPFDQATSELGNNLLVYTTEALPRSLCVFGTPRVSIYCATSSEHTDLTAKLVCVRADHVAEFICVGIARSSWLFCRKTATARTRFAFGVRPGADFLPFSSQAIASGWKWQAARSRLYDRNPGTNIPSCRATSWDWRRSTQIVHHGLKCPSALYLPVSESTE